VRWWFSSAYALAVLGPLLAQFPAPSTLPKDKRPKEPASAKAPTGATPRTKDGKVDFSGLWGASGFAADIARDLDVGQIPMRPEAAKLFADRQASRGKGDTARTCLPDGIPRSDSLAFKIMHNPDLLVIMYEGGIHTFRQVFLDGRAHPADLDPTWYGHSIGRWDGDAIVVDTAGQNGKTWLDQAGHPTTDKIHVTERITRPDLGHLRVEIAIDDLAAYTKPWTVTEVSPLLENRELRESQCNEAEIRARHLKEK